MILRARLIARAKICGLAAKEIWLDYAGPKTEGFRVSRHLNFETT